MQAKFIKIRSFTEYLQWLFLWFLQQNNLIFSVITITLGYIITKDCHGNTVISILPILKHPSTIKRMPIWTKDFVAFPTSSCPNLLILSSIYFCIIPIFLRESGGVFLSYTVSQGLSKIDCPIYQEENSPLNQKCSWNYSLKLFI